MKTQRIRNLILSLTNTCNYSCDYCYATEEKKTDAENNKMSYEKDGGQRSECSVAEIKGAIPKNIPFCKLQTCGCGSPCFMQEDVAEKALKLAASGETSFTVQFTGGEPLLNFPLIKFIAELVEKEKYPARLQIQTNGSLLTKKTAAYLKEHNIGIGISLDGVGEVNDLHRKVFSGGSAFKETLKALQLLAFMKIEVGVTCVITEDNIDHLKNFADFIFYQGNIRRVGFDLLRKCGRGRGIRAASSESVKRNLTLFYERVGYLQKITGKKTFFTQLDSICANANRIAEESLLSEKSESGTELYHCPAMQSEAAVVTPDGAVYACPSFLGDPDFLIGDIENGLNKEKMEFVRKIMYNTVAKCVKCESFGLCGGACFARVEGNSRRIAEEECAMQKACIEYLKKSKVI